MKNYLVNTKEMLSEHKRIIPQLRKVGLKSEAEEQAKELKEIKKKAAMKKIIKGKSGKGGPMPSAFAQASTPINLLNTKGEPPTAVSIPKAANNSFANK